MFDVYQLGRILPFEKGMYYNYGGTEHFTNVSIEFLVKSANYSYEWIASSNGTFVPNAVVVNRPRSSSQYIGRIVVNGITFIGSVVTIIGGMYYVDKSGKEKFTSSYEILVCKLPLGEF